MYSLQYNPLVLCKDKPGNFKDDKYTLKKYIGNPSDSEYRKENEKELDKDSLIKQSQNRRNMPKLLVCITTYNEPPKQLVESLIGVYRAYYELVEMDMSNLNKVQVVIVFDGYENLSIDDLKIYEQAGIYNAFCTKDYKHAELRDDKTAYDIRFNGKCHNILLNKIKFWPIELKFINEGVMNNDVRVYGANNLAHCFSRSMTFPEWLQGFDK